MLSSATRGTPRSASPPLRSMMDPAASTLAPRSRSMSQTSRVLPPVVITSSMTTAVSPGSTSKAAPQGHLAGRVTFGERKSGPQCSSDFVADDQPANRRGNHGLDRNARVGLFQLPGKHGAHSACWDAEAPERTAGIPGCVDRWSDGNVRSGTRQYGRTEPGFHSRFSSCHANVRDTAFVVYVHRCARIGHCTRCVPYTDFKHLQMD